MEELRDNEYRIARKMMDEIVFTSTDWECGGGDDAIEMRIFKVMKEWEAHKLAVQTKAREEAETREQDLILSEGKAVEMISQLRARLSALKEEVTHEISWCPVCKMMTDHDDPGAIIECDMCKTLHVPVENPYHKQNGEDHDRTQEAD